MTNKALGILTLGSLSLALGAYWFAMNRETTRGLNEVAGSNDSRPVPLFPGAQDDLTMKIANLEARREKWNQTVWATDLLAQNHEEVFIKLWDDLRNQEDTFAVLTNFRFNELRIGTPTEPEHISHDISIQRLGPPIKAYTSETWRGFLSELKENGYRLEQSEWRHSRFLATTNGTAESSIFVALHVLNAQKEDRCVVRGDLRVRWRKSDEPNAGPFPELIEASNLELLSRHGKPPFHHVLAADLTPEKVEPKLLEPSLQLYDLDGNGLSEIIIAARNRVFWNRGQGVFAPDQLLAYPLPGMSAVLLSDCDHDGQADLLAAEPHGLALYMGDSQGRFLKPPKRIRFTDQELANPIVMTTGDIDGDGDLDVWLAQYKVPYQGGQLPTPYYDANDGYPAYLLVNDGHGNFRDQTEQGGLAAKRFRRTYSSSFVDLDEDGDLDLLVVSDFAGADIYFNDGKGRFTDGTSRVLDEAHGFGMAHAFGDFDRDGHLDFFVVGMNSFTANRLDALKAGLPDFPEHTRMRPKMAYGNRLYVGRNGSFKHSTLSDQVARSGWSWGTTAGDFDNDGDLDIYVVNGHISGRSAKDYETQFWEQDIYTGHSKEDRALDQYFRLTQMRYQGAGLSYGGFEKNRLFLNKAGKSFAEAGYLMGVALEEDCRNAVSDDLDGDGKLDLVVVTFQSWPKVRQSLHLFPNFAEKTGNWIGLRLRESGAGLSPVGAKVILTTATGTQFRHFVIGDSYRSQHANTAHFGLGAEAQVQSVEVLWPNGQRNSVRNPAINKYHDVKPGRD